MANEVSFQDKIKSIGAIVVSIATAIIAIWWLWEVKRRLGLKPEVNAQGAILIDEFQRAKDILLVVLPLFSASLAYFVGSRGTADAKEEAAGAKEKLDAVLDSAPEGVLAEAKKTHPGAFKNVS